ncbi:MAG: hypothetical protein U9Q83_06975, partial [Bacteroidota bacterium]|nr:hypothetical protein [Bacteroidota bacterium]
MNQNNILSLKRFYLVIKRDVFVNLKTTIIAFGVLYAIFFIPYLNAFIQKIVFNTVKTINPSELGENFYTGFLIIGILLFAGSAFKDFRTKLKTQNYLLIPASTTEKFLSVLLISTIGFTAIYYLSFAVFNLLLILLGKIFSISITFFNVFAEPAIFEKIGVFLVFQSMFLAGAATFKKTPFLKTPLIAFAVTIGFSLLIGLASFLIFQTFNFEMNLGPNISTNAELDFLKTLGKTILYITPFVLWKITFFKLIII